MIHIEIFTDPMMGLSYESEPFLRYLETHFEGKITFSYTMAGLVRDVHDFMTSAEIALGDEKGLAAYNQRLAKIYKAEESISGLPMNMDDFKLFTPEENSTILLNLAYKTAELMNPDLAESFLYLLRYKTIVEGRQTTKKEEILKIAKEIGINIYDFEQMLDSHIAKENLYKDFQRVKHLKIYSLPAYLISFEGKSLLLQGVARTVDFLRAIDTLTDGRVIPHNVPRTHDHLERLLQKHPLISLIELRNIYDFSTLNEVEDFLSFQIKKGNCVLDGHFVKKSISYR